LNDFENPALAVLSSNQRGITRDKKHAMKLGTKTFGWLTMAAAAFFVFTFPLTAQTPPDRVWVGSSHTAAAYASAFSPDGTILASGSDDQTIKLWRVADGALLRTLAGHTGVIRGVAFSPDGATLASGSADTTIKLWRVADGALIRTLVGHTGNVRAVAFSPDNATLVSGGHDNTVRLWSVASGALLRTLTGHANWVVSVAFSPDGTLLASGSYDHTVGLWRASDGAAVGGLNHAGSVFRVSFSPDGASLLSASADLTARITRVADGTPLQTFICTDWVWSAAFSPDGATVLTADNDAFLKVWRVSDGALLQTLLESSLCIQANFSPVGQVGYGRGDAMVVLANPTPGTPPAPVALDLVVATTKPTYANKEKATILVSVTDGTSPLSGNAVSVAVTSSKGVRTSLNGTTGANGVAAVTYTVNSKQGTGTYKVSAAAARTGYVSASDATTFTVTR
jgi:WD40 repeat protein